ncbi:hypothetical protein FACS1894181_15390 [Bacteroidia bacterium]|nr:hypothetical protein FACS1894181_15390 [Bacteroidia bacterium]
MGVEMVAFSNMQGWILLIGVDDKTGVISGLSFEEIQQTNALLVNAASENVKPAIVIATETVNVDRQNIIVATIPKGKDKPYKDNKGIIWVKNGSDKRKVFSNAELWKYFRRLRQRGKHSIQRYFGANAQKFPLRTIRRRM